MKAKPVEPVDPSAVRKNLGKAVSDLTHNPQNPRTVDPGKLNQLKRSMKEFGDISGIVFNVRDGLVYGGTQRTKNLDSTAKVVITERFEKPTSSGTRAVGYVEQDGERFNYREVDWPAAKAKAAMIAANNNAGKWDNGKLRETMAELASFDVNFDLDLTLFSPEELKKKFSTVTVGEHQRKVGEDDEEETAEKTGNECPRCGYEF